MIDFSEIRDILEKVRAEYFAGKETDPAIYYMNGNDGTVFDLRMNGNLCEFYILKPNGYGLAKLYANRSNTYTVYVYDYDDPYNGKVVAKIEGVLRTVDVVELAHYLCAEKDDVGVWDAPIESWTLSKRADFDDEDDNGWDEDCDDEFDWEDDEDDDW